MTASVFSSTVTGTDAFHPPPVSPHARLTGDAENDSITGPHGGTVSIDLTSDVDGGTGAGTCRTDPPEHNTNCENH